MGGGGGWVAGGSGGGSGGAGGVCSTAMAACVLAPVDLIALDPFPCFPLCFNMIRFTGMSKWVTLFIRCSCLDPNSRRNKASKSQQEVRPEKKEMQFSISAYVVVC